MRSERQDADPVAAVEQDAVAAHGRVVDLDRGEKGSVGDSEDMVDGATP